MTGLGVSSRCEGVINESCEFSRTIIIIKFRSHRRSYFVTEI